MAAKQARIERGMTMERTAKPADKFIVLRPIPSLEWKNEVKAMAEDCGISMGAYCVRAITEAIVADGGEHYKYKLANWRECVANGDTELGYTAWVTATVEAFGN
jgi:hypothetical protein